MDRAPPQSGLHEAYTSRWADALRAAQTLRPDPLAQALTHALAWLRDATHPPTARTAD